MFPAADALAQFTFDGTQLVCVNDPANNDGIINTIGDSLELTIIIGGLDLYSDAVEVVFNPISGFGIIPTVPQTFSCPTGLFYGHRMQATVVHDSGIVTANPDSMKIRARYRFRPEGLCGTNPQTSYQVWARGVKSVGHDTLCGNSPTFNRAIPCSVCTGCGYIRFEELCGFVDGIIAIGDRVYLDTNAVGALEASLPPPTDPIARDTVFVNFNTLTCEQPINEFSDTVFVVGDIVDVVECFRENGFCGDTFQMKVGYWHGGWPPAQFDSVRRLSECVRPVDNVRPQVTRGMVDSFKILNGNAIANDSLVGCCDTLRIFMATDSSLLGGGRPFFGPVEGTAFNAQPCGTLLDHNFDMSWIGLWFGDLMGEARENDTSTYIYNSDQLGLLCPADTFLWMSKRFGTTFNPGAANNLMWIDIPFCSEDWDSLQICLLEDRDGLVIGQDTLFLWGFDDAGNRSVRYVGIDGIWTTDGLPWADTSLCIDVWPPLAELGSDIYLADGYCTKRFSPYDSADFAHMYTNLTPDSIEWIKGRVDTIYDATSMWYVFNAVYMIGFDVRVMPEDTAPLTRLNYLHPRAPIPTDLTLDTLRWDWIRPFEDPPGPDPVDSLQDALFRWWGKRGTDSIDAVLGTGDVFWKCASGGGLTVGITFARWMDAAGCNKILGWDYDGSTSINQNYTTRNVLRAVVDMCAPGFVLPGDTLICSNLPFNSGGLYPLLPGPTPKATYLWVGPNNSPGDSIRLRFHPKRNFAQNPFDSCLIEDTLFYRIRMDTVDLIYAIGAWPGVNDSARWYSGDTYPHRRWGSGNPRSIWTPIVFNAGDVNGPEIEFTWGHKWHPGPNPNYWLPDGLYKLSLELRDDAGNVTIDPIYIWLNGTGPHIDSIIVSNTDTVCTYDFYTTNTQDTLCVWLQTDTTADQVMIDWSCIHNIQAHPDSDTTYAQLVGSTSTWKRWFGYLIITPDMVSDDPDSNVYEIAPYEADCIKGVAGRHIINVRPLDITALGDTIYSEANPTHDCDKAAIGLTPCPRLLSLGDPPGYEYFYFADPDSPLVQVFGPGVTDRHAISPGKIDSMGGAGVYHAIFNWANDQVQDSIFVRLLIDSMSIRTDTLDTLILQFINPNYSPPRIREVRKGLFRPASASLVPDPWIHNTIFHGMLERDDVNEALVEFRYFWNGTWFIGAGEDSLMLVPYNQQDTILIKAFVQAVDTIIGTDTTYNNCPDTLYALLDVDNINPHFRNGWTDWPNPVGHHPVTGSSNTVKNLGWDADGDGDADDCGFRFSDGEHFRLKVKLTEKVHEFPNSSPYFPDTSGSHHDAGGYWPLTKNWQISPIDLRTGDIFSFGSVAAWDSCKVVLDSVLMDSVNAGNVYYTLYGYFDFPPSAITYFALNPDPVDSVALVIRAAWDEAGNPGRYNNPVFNDGLKNDACEDTTFFVTLTSPSPWTGCPLVYGRPDSVLGWITAEEDDVVVRVTIIETDEIAECSPGVHADSIHVLEGNFQTITDDPNPWVRWNSRSGWFLYPVGDPNPLGWARTYTFYLHADSSDLATIHCDGDYLPFILRFNTYAINWPLNSHTFTNCVQVDVNEPRWGQYAYLDSLHATLPACFDPRQRVTIVAQTTDALGDPVSCCTPGVGVLTDMIWADLSFITQNAALDSVVPDSVVCGSAYWTFMPDDTFACLANSSAWIRLHALHDSLHHHDRELFFQDTLNFCSDCLTPRVGGAWATCECDSITTFELGIPTEPRPLRHLSPGALFILSATFIDEDHDSSMGLPWGNPNGFHQYWVNLSDVDPDYTWLSNEAVWTQVDQVLPRDTAGVVWGYGHCVGQPPTINLEVPHNNGDTIFVDFAFCDSAHNCDTVWHYAVGIVDTLAPIIDYVYTISDDSIRAYVTPGDTNVSIYADITGYAEPLISHPEWVRANFSRFWCVPDSQAVYDTVYASYVQYIDANHVRAWWGWYPGVLYNDPLDSTTFIGRHFGVDPNWKTCHVPSVEGWHDTLWFYVKDDACNYGEAFSVFEASGIDSTVPAVDHVEIWGNYCHEGWISSTPLDSGHIEVWAFMDTVFNALSDTLLIDSMQANLAQLSPSYAWTQWGPGETGGAPVYGTVPNPADPVQTYWTMVGNRLVAKWVFLTARNLGCLDSVVVGVKAMRSTGSPASHGYYTDVEYGHARVDTTRPVIYDMRVHSSTTSINETTWVSPNVPLYVDVWAYDTNCDPWTDHLGFDLTDGVGGPGPFIAFCNPTGGFDTIWTWTPTSYTILHQKADSLDKAWIVLRWIGYPNFDDTCNFIDLDNITGCIEAHIEDCLSNPAVPVQRQVTTDDRPPQYVMSNSWGDYTHVTGFPGDPDLTGIDSVLVLQHGVYGLDYDSLLTVWVIVDNAPGDTLMSWAGTYINFDPWGPYTFLTTPIQYMDEVWFNIDGQHRDSLVWHIPLYGGGPLFNTLIPSDRYWFQLILADTMRNSTGDTLRPGDPGYHPFTLFCDDLDSAISFTIQNWNHPNPGMILLCDSTTVAGSDTDFVDSHNMNLWNNEFISPDTVMENLYKIYYETGHWAWYSHEDVNQTRFFIFVEDTVLQSDGIDNDADGLVDEVGEGVDFYTADLRINDLPQVGHVDSMNVAGHWIDYLWFADNFSQQRYDVDLFISDIYGHRDTLKCGSYNALQFFEDETCPVGEDLYFYDGGVSQSIRLNDSFVSSVDLPDLNLVDTMYVFANFDSIRIFVKDPKIPDTFHHKGSGPDLDTTTVDSINYNDGQASVIELLDPNGDPVLGFVQRYLHDYNVYDSGALMLVDPTGHALDGLSDGVYTIRVTLLDRVGNSCVRTWTFILDRTCPAIETAFTTRPGQNTETRDLYSSWDYVEIVAHVTDSLNNVDSVHFEYCFDANRDGVLDAYPFWQTVNILSDEGGAWDTEYPFIVYWNIRNLPWNSEDTLGLPPVRPDSCMNRYFVRVRAEDMYGHECQYVFPVDITDDIAPLAYISMIDHPRRHFDSPQGAVIPCYNPNTGLADSMVTVDASDFVIGGYDPNPSDLYRCYFRWFDLAKGVFQYKFFEAPGAIIPHNTNPALGWVNMVTPGQDTATYRHYREEDFTAYWNIRGLPSHQYNVRFVAEDVCGNSDALNTPVVTVRLECDTTAPIAVISWPAADTRLSNWRCNSDSVAANGGWVLVQSVSAIWADIDSVAFYFVDSLSVPGLGITTFIGGDGHPVPAPTGFATKAHTRWNTNNLLSGYYWLFAVAYDHDGNFDTNPIWQRVYVDNTAPVMDSCMVSTSSTWVGDGFYLRAYPHDPDNGWIYAVWFQYLSRTGNWIDLPNNHTVHHQHTLYGASISAGPNPDYGAAWDGSYEIWVNIFDCDQSPIDSIRFRALAVDWVQVGSYNYQGDRNRDCNWDRDLVCGGDNDGDGVVDLCCMAIEVRDRIPDRTNLWAFNHAWFWNTLPQYTSPTVQVSDGDQFSTCNYQHPLDNLLLVAKVSRRVEDGWLMHFKFWRSFPYGSVTAPQYVPNNNSPEWNPTIPPLGPIVLYHSWDSVYVVWTGARAYIDSADAADGLWYSQWSFSAQVEDLTGNIEELDDRNTVDLVFACLPSAPITDVSYVANDVTDPENRVRVTEAVPYTDFVPDTIEVLYNRTTGPGTFDPEALVIFYTDAPAIKNCRDSIFTPFNIQLYELNNPGNDTRGWVCRNDLLYPFGYASEPLGFDQSPPDDDGNNRYAVGLYLNNWYPPGVYNFAMIVRLNTVYFPEESKDFYEGDADMDDDFDHYDSTRIDLVVRVVNVNEPQLSICYPEYGATCVSGTVPMSASVLENPEFTGTIDTVWFQYFNGSAWLPILDPVTGRTYDTQPDQGYVRFEFDENQVPDMAGWYYTTSGRNVQDPELSWYASRDLFPDVWLWVEGQSPVPMYRDDNGLWTVNKWMNSTGCKYYGFIVDANDNNIVDPDGSDRYLRDPKEPCSEMMYLLGQGYAPSEIDDVAVTAIPASQVCLCDYWINFPSRDFANSSYNFRTVVGWHDAVAYHVIENPSLGDTIHVFFVDNEPAEAAHDIEFDLTRASGGMFDATPGGYPEVCNPADTVWFVTDIQPLGTHNLVVEDVCKVIYQVSLTNQPGDDHGWRTVATVLSDDDMGWTEAWPAYWVAKNPLKDNIDNDGDGLVDETHDVQAGDGFGEENIEFWTRSVVYDYCGNVYYSNEHSIWVDVSEPQACITQVGDVSPADNQVVTIPADRDLILVATDQSYADPGVIAIFQYRRLGVPSGDPSTAWRNIEAADWSNDTIRHIGNTYTAVWDLFAHQWRDTAAGYWHDPEGWFQLRAYAIDTVGNSDSCDHVICQITIRLNDIEPAARVSIYQIYGLNGEDTLTANRCGMAEYYYLQPSAPYCIQAIFAPTNIDTGLASLTFQYQSLTVGGDPSEWRNIETIYDHIDHALSGDTTRCVWFQPRPLEIDQHGFNIRVIVEDYNGNDTSAVVTLFADNTPPVGTGAAAPSIAVTGPCGPRCRLDVTPGSAAVNVTFLPDAVSGEINVAYVNLGVERDDGEFSNNFGGMVRLDDDTWTFDFGGDLCHAWQLANLDMGCYHFTVYFGDCAGNFSNLAVMTTCGEGEPTDLICVDCDPDQPELSTLDTLRYASWDCTLGPEGHATITDVILDGTTEIGGDQTVTICGRLPVYQQYVREVWLLVESEEAGVESTLVTTFEWTDTRTSVDSGYCFRWNLAAEDGEGNLLYPSGRYRVWVLAVDAICQLQQGTVDEFWVDVDHATPEGEITRILDRVPNPSAPDTFEVESFFGSGSPGGFWVEWTDGLTPDDSTQAHNRVVMWAKNHDHPNQADAWGVVGYAPSPCNPHWILWSGVYSCGETLDLVVVVQDRWGNGSLDVDEAMDAFADGRWVDIYLTDMTAPTTQLWSIGFNADPADEEDQVVVDQQNHLVHLASNYWDQDVYLNVFASGADENIERVHFQYSLDGTTWFDIATDENASVPNSCRHVDDPHPWWCDYAGHPHGRAILWSALWDISGLRGHVWVREWAQDVCGNTEGFNVYEVTIDVQAPMARVFAWMSDVNVDNLPCPQWTEPQIPDTLERYTLLTLGACPDSTGTVHYDANKAYWYIKRADGSPIDDDLWCDLGDDPTGPFSKSPVQLWNQDHGHGHGHGHDEDCLEPQVGAYYDIAVRMSDNNDHKVPWVQFLYNGAGTTPEDQWQDLINRGYVKRVKIVDHIAPVAHSIEVDTDCTPDSSVIFLHGEVHLTAMCEDPDVVSVTFAVREQGATGPWTIIDIVEGDGAIFRPSGCTWNTELMNGTYIIGAFAADYYGNRDGNPNVADAWPSHVLWVNVDNQRPTATIVEVLRNGEAVTSLERGAEHTFSLNATDNFGLRCVALYFRYSGGDPDRWRLIGTDSNWPYSFNWFVPESLVVGWTYDFAAVATDLCYQTDRLDGQGHYIVDGTFPIVDNETYLAIFTIGGQDAETTPHVNGTNVCLVAHSEPRLDNVRFLFVLDGDTTLIGTDVHTVGTMVWTLCGWDVTTLPEGPARLCAVGSADFGGNLVTLAVDCRTIVIDHSLPYRVTEVMPASHGLLGGKACSRNEGTALDDLWIRFNPAQTDTSIDTVRFEWKRAADPDEAHYWHSIGQATLDQGLTGRWAYAWHTDSTCMLITLRARVSDNAVPVSNEAFIIFADSVRVDNKAPEVAITNVNGDVTPEGTEVGYGQVATIVATASDPFCQGGNSAIDSVAFYLLPYDDGHGGHDGSSPSWERDGWHDGGGGWHNMIFLGGDGNGAPWQTMWNTSTVDPGHYTLKAIAWDEAGNCTYTYTDIYIVDQLYQRAWIIGFDADNDPGCDDRIWAVTDDCPPNYTSRVRFQYSTDGGTTWVSLGEDIHGQEWCDDELDYNLWDVEFEFDSVPTGAIYRAIATDESENDDPNPPRFMFSDVTASSSPVIYNEDLVRLHVSAGQVPWVSSMLEQAPPDENCFTAHGLVCVEPVEGDPTGYAGILASNTKPCRLDNRDGKVTVYAAVPVTRGNFTYMVLTKYEMKIHHVSETLGSNGWLTSEDATTQIYIPVDGMHGDGTLWFQPSGDDDVVNLMPPSQYYYQFLSEVEYVMTNDIEGNEQESRFRLHFNPALLPPNPQDWMVVAAYYDVDDDEWQERGIIYETRDFVHGTIEFHFANGCVNWDQSDNDRRHGHHGHDYCPNKLALAVMLTTVRPIEDWVHFANEWCDLEPDTTGSTYTAARGPSVGCDATWWAVLRQGEHIPLENTIDVYLDGIRIINDGEPDRVYGCNHWGRALFRTAYNTVSGVYSVRFTWAADFEAPWFASGCLRNGQHTIQFYTDNLHTYLTPFWVDRTEPEAFTYPEYINHQVNLWANLTDVQTGIDTNSAYVVISDCTPSAFTFREIWEIDTIAVRVYSDEGGWIGDSLIIVVDSFSIGWEVIINDPTRAFVVESEAMNFHPIPGGYRADFSLQWEPLHQWLIQNNNAGQMCVTWQFRNNVCQWNDSSTYVYTIDVEPPMVIPVSPIGAAIDDDNDGIANEDWRDCINNDNDGVWVDGVWHERIDEDPVNFLPDTLMLGERPTIQAVMNDLAMCGSGAAGVNVAGIWLAVDGQIFTIADTANPALNFHVMWPYNQQDDAYLMFGGTTNIALDRFYTPGEHRITCAAPDSAGNVGSYQFSWTYYVRASGPAIAFDTTTRPCGVFFNPEETNYFDFDVYGTANTAIAVNGIQYSVYTVPGGMRISGPTTINPTDPTHAHVRYNLSGSFPDGQTGIEIVVDAWNLYYNPQVDTLNGITHSRMTFWADNVPPTFTSHAPQEGEIFNRDQAIVIEVFYSDDTPGGMAGAAGGATATKAGGRAKQAEMRVSRLDEAGNVTSLTKSRITLPDGSRGRGTLDDNGSGIDVSSFRMSIVKPNGAVIEPTVEQFIELDRAHAKYVLQPVHIPGLYTVNVRVEDCVGNVAADAWTFHVASSAPAITFTPVEGECQWQGYWNPDGQLHLRAQISEMDGINTTLDGIHVDIVRVYNCEGGLCTDTLVHDAEYRCSPLPDPVAANQVFHIEGDYNLDQSLAMVELRFVVTATNVLGAAAVRVQPWIVDGTAPWITIVSPLPNSVLPETMPVTISANFGDTQDGSVAMLPAGRNGGTVPTVKIGPQRIESRTAGKSSANKTKLSLGAWADAVGGNLDDLDGNSGVDVSCVELMLFPHDGSPVRNLTESAVIRPNNITWIGDLSAGSYSVILSVCDRVCNTASTNWDFAVAPDAAGVTYDPPYFVSAMPHTFIMHTYGENIDHASMNLTIEGAITVQSEGGSYEIWVPVVERAAVQWLADSVWYTANFDLATYVQLRLTLRMNFAYGIPVPTGSQVYVVDTNAPRIVSVMPDPAEALAVGASPTFTINFVEVGNTALDPVSVRLWLTTANSEPIPGEFASSLDGSRRTGLATLRVNNLAIGSYILRAEVADVAGNRATGQWTYQVEVSDHEPPRVVGLSPSPRDTLQAGTSPTFVVDLEEVGTSTLDSASIRLWMETVNSELVAGHLTVTISGNRRTATAQLRVENLPGDCRLYLEASDMAGNRLSMNWLYATAVIPPPAKILDHETAYNYPNPFGPGEGTHFWLPVSPGTGAHVEIKLYDFAGMHVATIYEGYLMPGTEIEWTGRNDDGQMVANGVYLAHVITSADGKSKEDIVKVAFKDKK
jgi:hypothetical protein